MTFHTTRWAAFGLLATLAVSALSPAALADSRQKNKNTWRNLAGAAAAVAGYGLLKGNSTATLLGAAGAAYSANRYEKDRRSQSQRQGYWNRNYYRRARNNGYQSYRNGYTNNGYQSYGNRYNSGVYNNGNGRGHGYGRRGRAQGDNDDNQGEGRRHGHRGHGGDGD